MGNAEDIIPRDIRYGILENAQRHWLEDDIIKTILIDGLSIFLPEGERFVFDLPPEEAFGVPNPRLVERIALAALPPGMDLKPNSVVEFTAPDGNTFSGFLREQDATHGLFDFNHPLAGKSIRFEVEIIGIL